MYPEYSEANPTVPNPTVYPPPRWRNRRQIYPQISVMGIPPAILPTLQNLKFNKGIPMSWLAAVCERTHWNPSYQVLNATMPAFPSPKQTVRQFGIAGIWAHLPEVFLTNGNGCLQAPYMEYHAGWLGYSWDTLSNRLAYNCKCTVGSYSLSPGSVPNFASLEANLNLAADILLDCANSVQAVCGEINSLMFLRWQWGCRYLLERDLTGKCVPPPNIADIFTAEMDTLVELQRIYAEQLNEEPIVPRPLPVPGEGGSLVPVLGLLGLVGLVGVFGLAQREQKKRGIVPR